MIPERVRVVVDGVACVATLGPVVDGAPTYFVAPVDAERVIAEADQRRADRSRSARRFVRGRARSGNDQQVPR